MQSSRQRRWKTTNTAPTNCNTSSKPIHFYQWTIIYHLWLAGMTKNKQLTLLSQGKLALGGFNVSNLMGITRRMIDIGKKITFYFLLNVWTCTVFSHLHFKIANVLLWPKNIFCEKYQYGYQKNSEFYAYFKFVDADLNKCPKKARAKKTMRILSILVFVNFSWWKPASTNSKSA